MINQAHRIKNLNWKGDFRRRALKAIKDSNQYNDTEHQLYSNIRYDDYRAYRGQAMIIGYQYTIH